MLRLILVTIAMAALVTGREISRNADPADNVNSRYTVESVELLGFAKSKLSRTVRERIDKLVGNKYNTMAVSGLVWKIREEVRARHINVRVGRGQKPEHVAVRLEVQGQRHKSFDVTSPKFGYHSRQGFSGGLEGVINAGHNLRIAGGYTNDGDLLLERFQGVHGRTDVKLGESPVTLQFRIASYRQAWNLAVPTAGNNRYRTREIFEPAAKINLARGLDWTSGVSVQRLIADAAPAEASNAMVNTVHYRHQFEGDGTSDQTIEAAYDVRAATRALSSDYRYNRHTLSASYTFASGRHEVRFAALAGFLNGNAPLFDRYLLGNTQTLRGYNKFDLSPNGARRISHGSIDYSYRLLQLFYDSGTVASIGPATPRTTGVLHSVGCGLRKDSIQLAVAFPLRGQRMDPMFLIGVNF